jgi:hypothetical protein
VAKKKIISFENMLQNIHLFWNYAKKRDKQVYFLLIKAPNPPESARSARQKQTHTKLVKSARNLPEIGSLPEIFFARQMTFKSARILQIWRRKPPSGRRQMSTATNSQNRPALPDDFFQIRQICCKNPPENAKQNWSNPPEIRQKLGWFEAVFHHKGSFCGFFSADFALSQKWQRGNIYLFLENILHNIYLFWNYFL